MKNRTCCFTGHRILPAGPRQQKLAENLKEVIMNQIQNGIQFFGTGGALGFDTLAAKTVIELRRTYSHIRLILVLPCLAQTRGWPIEDVSEYERIAAQADKVVYTSQAYTADCMLKRNRHLVDNSSVCVCYLIQNNGGTAYTVDYAKKQGLEIINLALAPCIPRHPSKTNHR